MPPARFGPGDARELAQTLARLQHSLARVRVPQEGVQLTLTASEHVPSDSDLNQAIDRVPGLRQLLGKVRPVLNVFLYQRDRACLLAPYAAHVATLFTQYA